MSYCGASSDTTKPSALCARRRTAALRVSAYRGSAERGSHGLWGTNTTGSDAARAQPAFGDEAFPRGQSPRQRSPTAARELVVDAGRVGRRRSGASPRRSHWEKWSAGPAARLLRVDVHSHVVSQLKNISGLDDVTFRRPQPHRVQAGDMASAVQERRHAELCCPTRRAAIAVSVASPGPPPLSSLPWGAAHGVTGSV